MPMGGEEQLCPKGRLYHRHVTGPCKVLSSMKFHGGVGGKFKKQDGTKKKTIKPLTIIGPKGYGIVGKRSSCQGKKV